MNARVRRAALILFATGLAAGAAGADAALDERLAAALRHPGFRGGEVAALVVGEDGAPVFARAADRALIPASNMKILTALAALETLGPTYRFTTRVLADRAPDADGAVGWLALVGGGDPLLTSEQWWRLAADLRRVGVRKVEGDVWLDDSAFDAQRWHPGWGVITTRAYHAPIGALAANFGAFAIEVRPGVAPGEAARSVVDPPVSSLKLLGRVRTRNPSTPAKLVIKRTASAGQAEAWSVAGVVPARGEAEIVWRSVADPTRYAGAVFAMQLDAVGIAAPGPRRRGAAPEGGIELLAFEGDPLGRIVNSFVKFSSNPVAEMMFKNLGRAATGEPGSWSNGRTAVRDSLTRMGVWRDELRIADGSGLSRDNRVSPRALVAALLRARDAFEFGPELVSALPIANADGTLKKRLGAVPGRVRAKTGLLDGVTGLSGYAEGPQGLRVFSILTNGHTRGDKAAMDAVDAFAAALTRP
jgi:D-alanyl-D-alanine carboxypeptidase/D-alanyl-D-alanine-endopeptidase (penicillin-binding protein 4)